MRGRNRHDTLEHERAWLVQAALWRRWRVQAAPSLLDRDYCGRRRLSAVERLPARTHAEERVLRVRVGDRVDDHAGVRLIRQLRETRDSVRHPIQRARGES